MSDSTCAIALGVGIFAGWAGVLEYMLIKVDESQAHH